MKNSPASSDSRSPHPKANIGATVFSRRLVCAAFLLGASGASAANVNWKGGAGTTADWFTGSNWDTGSAPGAGDDTILNQGPPGGLAPVIDGGNAQTRNLYIGTNSYQSLTISNSNTVVGGALILGAATGSGSLYLAQNASLTSSGAIIGDNANGGTVELLTATSSWANSGILSIGDQGAGEGILRIHAGASVTSDAVQVGVNSTSGKVSVDGAGATLTATATLQIGRFATGDLLIQNGGTVNAAPIEIGAYQSSGISSVGTATVDGSGSVLNTTTLVVGRAGQGTLDITGGGLVHSTASSNIGAETGGEGTVNVQDAGTRWTLDGALFVGNGGTGSLAITNGGAVTSASASVAQAGGSIGTVLVSGAGSQWNNTGLLLVGNAGTGALTIDAGGLVTNGDATIGNSATNTAYIAVTGSNSKWSSSGILAIGNGGKGRLTVSGGGLVESASTTIGNQAGSVGTVLVQGTGATFTSGVISVGTSGNGTLTVASGGTVNSTTVTNIGQEVGGYGTVEVAGSNALLTVGTGLFVGLNGQGVVSLSYSGLITSTSGSLGQTAGSTGTVYVDGTGSRWTNSGALFVGNAGTGIMEISGGGVVQNTDATIGNFTGSSGIVRVSGAGSKWINSGTLVIGNSGSGEIDISAGGSVETGATTIGNSAGITGYAYITGAGSTWTNTEGITVGKAGKGEFSVSDGAQVIVNGTLAGSPVDSLVIGENAGAEGLVTVGDAGSKLTLNKWLTVGGSGKGTLNITDGGVVEGDSLTTFIGANTGSEGHITVSGVGSRFGSAANPESMYVANGIFGDAGQGELTITAGGVVESDFASVGGNHGEGRVTVSGAGSQWNVSADAYFGDSGNGIGHLTIEAGGVMNSGNSFLALGATGIADATVTGAGSQWNANRINVGDKGAGTLLIEAGGVVALQNEANIGKYAGSVGRLTVTGTGSKLTLGDHDDLSIGNSGTGALTISDGGLVKLTKPDGVAFVAHLAGSTGTLNIGSAAGEAASAPGTLEATAVEFGAGAGSINFNHTATDYTFAASISGNGAVNIISGTTTLTGVNTYTGGTNITGGTVIAGNSRALGTGPITVRAAGIFDLGGTAAAPTALTISQIDLLAGTTLRGSGSFGTLVNNGGTVSPGHSPGTIVLAGDFVNNGGVLDIEIEGTGAGQFDQIRYAGRAIIAPGSTINITLLAGYIPQIGDNISFLLDTDPASGPSVTGDFDTKNLPALAPGLRAAVVTTPTGISFVVFSSTLANTPGFTPHDGLEGFIAALPGNTPAFDSLGALGVTQGGAALSQAITNASPIGLSAMDALIIDENRATADFLRERAQAQAGAPQGEWSGFVDMHGVGSTWDTGNDTGTFNQNFYGGRGGLSSVVAPGLTVGFVGGYDSGTARLHNDGGRIEQDRGSVSAYAACEFADAAFAYAGLTGGFGGFDTRRETLLGRITGKTGSFDIGLTAGVGYRIRIADTLQYVPYVGLAYTHAMIDGYEETGGPLALRLESRDSDSLRFKFGNDLAWRIPAGAGSLSLALGAAFEHEALDDDTGVTGAFSGGSNFTVRGRTLSRNSVIVGPKIGWEFTPGQNIGAGYDYEYGFAGTASHRFNVAYTARF